MTGVYSFLAFLVALCLSVSVNGQSADKPNVILITLDDCNDWLSFLDGHSQSYTPNLHNLANEGVSFTNAFTTSPVCAPSRTSYLSGKSTDYTGVFTNTDYIERLGPDRIFRNAFQSIYGNEVVYTLPEWLKDSGGYYTVGVGKNYHGWLAGGHDNDTDLDQPDKCNRTMSWSHHYAIDPAEPEPLGASDEWHDGVTGIQAGPLDNSQEVEMVDYATADSAIQFLQEYQANPADFCDRPFFMAVGMFRPHTPHTVPEKYFSEFYQPDLYQFPYDPPFNNPRNAYPRNGIMMPNLPYNDIYADFDALSSAGKLIARGTALHSDFENYARTLPIEPIIADSLAFGSDAKQAIIAESRRANVVMSYLAAITFVDAQVGRIMSQLNSNRAMAENTIIIVMSDHGFSHGKKKHWFKNGLWDTDIRIPFMVIDPRRSGGTTSTGTVSTLDLFPTLCDMLGISEPTFPDGSRYLDGISIVPLLENPSAPWSNPVVTALKITDRVPSISCTPHYSVRTDRWHYIRYRETESGSDCASAAATIYEELYDIGEHRENDVEEWDNLADKPEFGLIKNWLANFLEGGSNYGLSTPPLEIAALGDMPCSLDSNSSFSLVPVIDFDPQDEGLSLVWRYGHDGVNIKSDTLVVDAAAFGDDFWSNNDELLIYLVAQDSLRRKRSIQTYRLPLSSKTPTADFSIEQNGFEVTLRPNEDAGTKVSWDFGDGFTTDDRYPGMHAYTRPLRYYPSQTIYYGEKQGCSVTYTDTVDVESSVFDSICMTPVEPTIVDVGPDRVYLVWNSVHRATGYEWRLRKTSLSGFPWLTGNAGKRAQVKRTITHLYEGKEYEVQTRAQCNLGEISQWSGITRFRTPPCRPPAALEVTATDSSATVSWEPRQEATSGYSMALLKPDMTPLTPEVTLAVTAGESQISLDDLEDNTDYMLVARSRCDQIFTEQYYPGRLVSFERFTTEEAPSLRLAGLQNDISLVIQPNPADEIATIVLGTESGSSMLVIYDFKGTEMASAQMDPGQSWTVDLKDWPVGNYLVSAQGSGRVVQQLVVSR